MFCESTIKTNLPKFIQYKKKEKFIQVCKKVWSFRISKEAAMRIEKIIEGLLGMWMIYPSLRVLAQVTSVLKEWGYDIEHRPFIEYVGKGFAINYMPIFIAILALVGVLLLRGSIRYFLPTKNK